MLQKSNPNGSQRKINEKEQVLSCTTGLYTSQGQHLFVIGNNNIYDWDIVLHMETARTYTSQTAMEINTFRPVEYLCEKNLNKSKMND